ncbi:hypothetical protein ISN45_Aa06g035980 [Arabidopsis thaliana x Arabidopsis arenosa]|uniref:Uncharacterized protein n=1 Tax=Arabidopsis thaliana x Arabidopsis arenosa TaxID=1240361 RepID=A0A8T1Z2N6_9BRAS|nr:hypothetical protein ISN45_Aa06g035980 [Arabidopsis thaliana x Arabidopsis arenosa]
MSVMIESKRPPVYIDNQMSLDTFFLIRGGDPSVNLFVSFITTVKAVGNTVSRTDGHDAESDCVCGSAKTPNPIVAASNVDANNEAVDEQDDVEDDKTDEDEEEEDKEDGDGYDDHQGDDGSIGGSSLDPTIDGSEGNVEEDVILTQQTVQHPGKFSRLLAECTYTSQRVPGGDNISHLGDSTPTVTPTCTCRHGLYQCTYTTDCTRYMLRSAAKDYRVRDFIKYFEQLRAKRPGCANYLEEIGFEHWTRSHCKGERYNIMSSNNSEAMNNVLTKAKTYPIVYMIEFIREVLMRWFAARRKKVARCKSLVTPEHNSFEINNNKGEDANRDDVDGEDDGDDEGDCVVTETGLPFAGDPVIRVAAPEPYRTAIQALTKEIMTKVGQRDSPAKEEASTMTTPVTKKR